jgi:glycine/D-amino acid oxidase-like deaminating enzyme
MTTVKSLSQLVRLAESGRSVVVIRRGAIGCQSYRAPATFIANYQARFVHRLLQTKSIQEYRKKTT